MSIRKEIPLPISASNPNNSNQAIEGILSPDGRVFGKMGHSERIGRNLYRNVPGNFDQKLFESGDRIFQIENEYGKRSRFRLRSGSGGPDR